MSHSGYVNREAVAAKLNMSNEIILKEWLQSPAIAMHHLVELFDAVSCDDETSIELATEALENCGPPTVSELDFLRRQLESQNGQRVYWACTLLGRMRRDANELQNAIVGVLSNSNSKAELAAEERAAWCLGQIGGLNAGSKSALKTRLKTATPRLQRLIAAALETG